MYRNWHGRFVLAGLTIGLAYFPIWLFHLISYTLTGSTVMPLILGCIAVAAWQLWSGRKRLAQLEASEADELLGRLLIVSGLILFPLCWFAVWPLSILWLFALVGIAISTWGPAFFRAVPLSVLLLAVTAYPKPGIFAKMAWQTLTPYKYLERFMAWAGATGLQLLGLPAISEGTLVTLPPTGSVSVDWGCNGFSMACSMAASGFFMGLLLKQRGKMVMMMTIIGALLALIFNIPRIMLLAVASIHWGDASFDFWHGVWGGQIFSAVLFTVYYYTVMAIIKRRPKQSGKMGEPS